MEDDEKLIFLVQQNEILYDLRNKSYSDSAKKEKVWKKIGDELKKPGQNCKSRWSNLRDQYRRVLRTRQTSNQSTVKIKKWKFEDEMSFLLPFFQERETTSSVPNMMDITETSTNNTDDNQNTEKYSYQKFTEKEKLVSVPIKKHKSKKRSCTETPSTALMRYIIEQNDKETSKSNNADDNFFISMAETVKSFNPFYKNLAKRKIFEIVSNFEMEQIKNPEKQGQPSHFHQTLTGELSQSCFSSPPSQECQMPTQSGESNLTFSSNTFLSSDISKV